ncbi:MAG TPA: RNA-binding protein [Candidatus Saccharimonadia bacterium]|nr:RNA-binding protein [Candidatus Saccharimonadia bacterium]
MNQNTKLYVGNLSYSVTTDELKQMFAQYGTVTDAIVLVDKFTGRSKGFGFVTFETSEQAQAAVDALNGTDQGGRKIVVSLARPMVPRENRGGFGGGQGGDRGGDRGGYNRGGGYGNHGN